MAKQKEIKPRVSIKREVPKLPGYIMCVVWLIFTILLIGWVILASFSTSREILSGELFKFASGFHFENYTNAWKSQKISVFFVNSLIYTAISCTMIILVAAPAAYALSRFKFRGNMILQNLFATALGIPVIMIVMPLFSIITSLKITNTREIDSQHTRLVQAITNNDAPLAEKVMNEHMHTIEYLLNEITSDNLTISDNVQQP